MPTQRAASPSVVGERSTVIGPGIRVNGRVQGAEDLHVEGRVEGAIELEETLYVSTQGIVVAEVRARDVVVSGVVVGNVTAEDSVTLHPGAKLVGDLTAPRVIIADGAAFSGKIAMGGEAPPPRRERPRVAARPRVTSSTRPAARSAPRAVERSAERTEPRVAAIPHPSAASADDEVTVVVRHAELGTNKKAASADESDEGARRKSGKKKAKRAPPRARVPKPGKRRVNRR